MSRTALRLSAIKALRATVSPSPATTIELDAIPFKIADIDFSHNGEKCSFDTFLVRFDIQDPVLHKLTKTVRVGRGLVVGCVAGNLAANDADHTALAYGMVIYDALYSWI
jgi:hypothetical protein